MIVTFFSVATYLRYRAAAWKAFDTDMETNLQALQSALNEEIHEAAEDARKGAPGQGASQPLERGTAEAVAAFRLSGVYAEVRTGAAAQVLLARVPGAGLGEDARLLDDGAWKQLAESPQLRVLELPDGRRGVARTFRSLDADAPVTLAVVDQTTLVEQTLGAIRRAFFQFGAAGLSLALAGGYWLATRALRPIDTLTTQAGVMASSPATAGARLPILNPHDELGRLGMTFNRLLERIELSMTQTRAFIADAAHELKTPVAIVRTEAELSLSRHRSLEESREALSTIAAESAHLSRLVSDLTLLAEGELLEHPLERRLVDLRELMHDVGRSLKSLAEARRVEIEIEAPSGVEYRGDERLLRQICVNLLENAIKFSRPGSRVGTVLAREGGFVELSVLDEAPTLSAADQGRVFERFYRSPQAVKGDTAGSGLGLAIVAWAVKLHGGQIRVEPRAPSGNRFVVTLPLVVPQRG